MLSRGSKLTRACKPAALRIAPRTLFRSTSTSADSHANETLKMKVAKINEHSASMSDVKHSALRNILSYGTRGVAMYSALYMSSYMIVASIVSAGHLGEPLLTALQSIDSATFQEYISSPKVRIGAENPNVVVTTILTNLLDVVSVPATAYLTHKWVKYARLRDAERLRVVPDSYTHMANPNMPATRAERDAPVA